MSRIGMRTVALLGLVLGASSCTPEEEAFPNSAELEQLRALHSPLRRPPVDPTNQYGDNPAAVALGTRLFNDEKLSSCGTVSCKSCHDGEGKTVSEATALGCDGQRTGRNPPSILNSGYSVWYMWDGRADRLWNQALLPLLSPIEMHSSPAILRDRLSDATYVEDYRALFGALPSEQQDEELLANFGKAIAAYERTQNRVNAPFDQDVLRFIAAAEAGPEQAEADPAYLGLKTFFRKGQCVACHKGPLLTDDLFHNIGVKDGSEGKAGVAAAGSALLDWVFNASGPYSDKPVGPEAGRLQRLRTDLAQKPATFEGAFKTPTLRNVALTAPYMHTGELATLEDVIELYNKGGESAGSFAGVVTETIKPLELTDPEKKALVDLLESMTGAPAQ